MNMKKVLWIGMIFLVLIVATGKYFQGEWEQLERRKNLSFSTRELPQGWRWYQWAGHTFPLPFQDPALTFRFDFFQTAEKWHFRVLYLNPKGRVLFYLHFNPQSTWAHYVQKLEEKYPWSKTLEFEKNFKIDRLGLYQDVFLATAKHWSLFHWVRSWWFAALRKVAFGSGELLSYGEVRSKLYYNIMEREGSDFYYGKLWDATTLLQRNIFFAVYRPLWDNEHRFREVIFLPPPAGSFKREESLTLLESWWVAREDEKLKVFLQEEKQYETKYWYPQRLEKILYEAQER